MAKYRKKPFIVDAVQYDGTEKSLMGIHDLKRETVIVSFPENRILLHTDRGDVFINLFDYVVRNSSGNIRPIKPEIFEDSYILIDQKSELSKLNGK